MSENVGIRLLNGPLPTTNIYPMTWPPADEVTAFSHPILTGGSVAIVTAEPPDGFPEGATIARYRKVRQSRLGDDVTGLSSAMVRGAEYEHVDA